MWTKIKQFFTSVNKCDRPNCQNPSDAFGICEDCFFEEMKIANDNWKNKEHQKLVNAFKQAILEVKNEHGN